MARTADSSKLRVLVVAATLATLAALAGCGGGEPAARPTSGVDHDKLVEAVKCMRASGFPDFPDPIQDEGFWVIPEPAANLTPPPASHPARAKTPASTKTLIGAWNFIKVGTLTKARDLIEARTLPG